MRPDTALRAIADAQLHLVTGRQLRDAGFTDDQIRHRVRTGALRALHPGVDLTAGDAPSLEQRGWRVAWFTWWDVHDRPLYVVLVVADALGLRPRAWTRRRSPKTCAR